MVVGIVSRFLPESGRLSSAARRDSGKLSRLSLRRRLLIAAAFILVTFLGLAGIALDRAFISSAELSQRTQLRTQTFALLSVLEVDPKGEIVLPRLLPEARLMVPNSGLYALIIDKENKLLWQSGSSLGVELGQYQNQPAGTEQFRQLGESLSSPFMYSFSISWETELGEVHAFTLVLVEAGKLFATTVAEHRRKIVVWLGMAGFFLLIMQMIALNWSLRPLSRVSDELDQIETAQQDRILGDYPDEIAQLSERINLFIGNERKNQERYRNTLGDLAHSLKTPLAVVKGLAESRGAIDHEELDRYADRMTNIVEYQLKRAASSQVALVHGRIDVSEVVNRIVDSLDKVYADKKIQFSNDLESGLMFYGDESDLYELLGNILDNAYKWAESRVHLTGGYHRHDGVSRGERNGRAMADLELTVEDDGPGVAKEVRELISQRGIRADEQTDGQGIGLAVSREIIERYDGRLEIGRSDWGGASFRITLHPGIAV